MNTGTFGKTYLDNTIHAHDLECLTGLTHEASDTNILLFLNVVSKLRFSYNNAVNPQMKIAIDTIRDWLSRGEWSLPIKTRLHDLIVNSVSQAREYNNLWRFGTELRNLATRFEHGIPNFEDHIYESFQDMLLLSSRDIVSRKQSDLFLEWRTIMSPGFLQRAFEQHPAVFNLVANRHVANSISSRWALKNYALVYKHANVSASNIMSYWLETQRLFEEEKKVPATRYFSNYIDVNPYRYDTQYEDINYLRAFWFKLALRQHVTLADIEKLPEPVGNLIIQSAAHLYLSKSHPMIGNFLKTVIPMLREYIDSGFTHKDNIKDLNMKMLTVKIESVELPDTLFDY